MKTLSFTSKRVFEEHARYVFRVLRYLGVPEADLPDVCQEVFITVHRKIDEFEGRSSVRTWLYRICNNAASDQRRRAHVRREIATDWTAPERQDDPATSADLVGRVEARSVIDHALGLLDEDKRLVFVLYEIEGFTMQEVADVVGCPLQTAYSRLRTAREIIVRATEPVIGGA
jgi:RNA polymerase sigma-70 factor (ECF subfamily)